MADEPRDNLAAALAALAPPTPVAIPGAAVTCTQHVGVRAGDLAAVAGPLKDTHPVASAFHRIAAQERPEKIIWPTAAAVRELLALPAGG